LGIPQGTVTLTLTLEMRFIGQAFEVPVQLTESDVETLTFESLTRRFAEAHHRTFRHGSVAQQQIEIMSFRLGAHVAAEQIPSLCFASGGPIGDPTPHRI